LGSTFTLFLPAMYAGPALLPSPTEREAKLARSATRFPSVRVPERGPEKIPDDRDAVAPGDATLLIGEADPHYARVRVELAPEGLTSAFSRLKEYSAPRRKRLLVVEDNAIEQRSITELLSSDDVEIHTAATGSEALDALRGSVYDCAVVDLKLPDISGLELLE